MAFEMVAVVAFLYGIFFFDSYSKKGKSTEKVVCPSQSVPYLFYSQRGRYHMSFDTSLLHKSSKAI